MEATTSRPLPQLFSKERAWLRHARGEDGGVSGQPEPLFHPDLNLAELRCRKYPHASKAFHSGNRQHALDVECACLQEMNRKVHFKLTAPWLRCVRNDLDQR